MKAYVVAVSQRLCVEVLVYPPNPRVFTASSGSNTCDHYEWCRQGDTFSVASFYVRIRLATTLLQFPPASDAGRCSERMLHMTGCRPAVDETSQTDSRHESTQLAVISSRVGDIQLLLDMKVPALLPVNHRPAVFLGPAWRSTSGPCCHSRFHQA